MSGWSQAGREDRRLLIAFTCCAPADHTDCQWYLKTPDDQWAQKAQSLVRSIRSPKKPPEHCFVLHNRMHERLDAVIAFRDERISDTAHHFRLNVLARHLDCSGRNVGLHALEQFTAECLRIIESYKSVDTVVLTAEAHKENAPVHRLLAKTQWHRWPDQHHDPDYEYWGIRIAIAPRPLIARPRP